MELDRPNSSTSHRASSGIRPCRTASTVLAPKVTFQACCLIKSVIQPIRVDRVGVPDVEDDLPDIEVPTQPALRRVLPGIQVAIPDLMGVDLSHHTLVHLHANEV